MIGDASIASGMAFEGLNIAQQEIGNAWKICSPFMKEIHND